MQRLTVSSQHGNLDDSTPAELPEINSISVDHHLEDGNPTSNSPTSPGLRSALSTDSEGVEKYHTTKGGPSIIKDNNEVAHQAPERKKTKSWLLFILGAIACLIIGLTVGLAVGLTRKRSSTPAKNTPTTAPTQPPSGGPSPTPNYLSAVGAFNGTGIALASESSGSDVSFLESTGFNYGNENYGKVVMYFQHHTGQIREMQLGEDGEWAGGNSTNLVVPAAEVKNGTPIAAVSYVFNNISTWHIFYISINNTVQELINNNVSDNWAPGPINSLNLETIDDPHVGLQACWNAYSYSAADNSSNQTSGITLLYGKDSTTFGVAGWTASNNTWKQEKDLIDYNGHGGVACYSQSQSDGIFLMLVNLQHDLNILWKDPDTTLTSSETPWIKTNVSIPVFQNTSIGYTEYFLDGILDSLPSGGGTLLFAQDPDLSIVGWSIILDDQNTSVPTSQNVTINSGNGIPGTHLTCQTSIDFVLQIFYQTNGTNIEQFESDLTTPWSMLDVPIPAS